MRFCASVLFIASCLVLGGCGEGETPISNDRLIESFEQGRTGIWVSAEAPVVQLLGDEDIGGRRQRFTIKLKEDVVVQVRHSLDDSTRVPVERGDVIRVQGFYQWDARGGFISRTFADPNQPGGGGWIEHESQRYD